MDYFKIVYIRDLKELEPIPHKWEENNVCWFPSKKKDIIQFQCNASKDPEKMQWPHYACQVKVNGIIGWQEANDLCNFLCSNGPFTSTSEEDNEDDAPSLPTKRKRRTPPRLSGFNKAEVHDLKDEIIRELKGYIDGKFTDINIQLENMLKEIKNGNLSCNNVTNEEKEEEQSIGIFPLSDVNDINQFEKKLENEGYFVKIVTALRKRLGTGFTWRQACYRLTSMIFTKELLTHYSWTGVSRTNTKTQKFAFNKLEKILGAFYHVVRFSDGSFTHANREVFFRDGVLKHSYSRLHSKRKKPSDSSSEASSVVTGKLASFPETYVESQLDVSEFDDNLIESDSESHDVNGFPEIGADPKVLVL